MTGEILVKPGKTSRFAVFVPIAAFVLVAAQAQAISTEGTEAGNTVVSTHAGAGHAGCGQYSGKQVGSRQGGLFL